MLLPHLNQEQEGQGLSSVSYLGLGRISVQYVYLRRMKAIFSHVYFQTESQHG